MRRRDQQDRVIGRQRALGIAQHLQVVLRDAAVAGEGADHVDVARDQRAVHQVGLVLPLHREVQAIGRDHRAPFGSREDLEIAADLQRGA
ncbi:MAG: hypothetical protein WDN03_20035 [Rhizomicrobium sp.]